MEKNFLKAFSYKIKSPIELNKYFKKNKLKKILCHGNFDVVHPGHIRHLLYAKSKADILIVSITADRFIKKGMYRPHIPQNLRALNLAALEVVDFVIIDDKPKPDALLKKIKPEFFAKGYEYNADKLHEDSAAEMQIVKSYGGEMIFTPGDVIYSSTNLINENLPNIDKEKILNVMQENNITIDILKKNLSKFKNKKIHVIGDTIIDVYTRASVIGGQIKTPTLSVLHQKADVYIGGAAIVAQHLKAAGADVTFTTILGNDEHRDFVIKKLKEKKIKINPIILSTRPTTSKNAIIAGGYRILKIDKVDNQPVNKEVIHKLCKFVKKEKSDCVVLSDFRHGIFHAGSISKICKSISKKTLKVADSQVATRWGNITDFKNFDIIFPNEREARFCLADQDSSISSLCRRLLEESKCKNLVLKLGEKGLYGVVGNKARYTFTYPSFTKEVKDPVGAGDSLLAYTTLSYLVGSNLAEAVLLGSLAAGVACEYDGNISVSKKDILLKLQNLEKLINFE
jgi:rfaE bifunctional protein kinase chain/domain/rfaE bifunctional protein nucleotidyltransferase chain/domain